MNFFCIIYVCSTSQQLSASTNNTHESSAKYSSNKNNYGSACQVLVSDNTWYVMWRSNLRTLNLLV